MVDKNEYQKRLFEYYDLVYKNVDGRLEQSLMTPDAEDGLNIEAVELMEALKDDNFRKAIISRIVSHAIKYTDIYYIPELDDKRRELHYMENVYSFLTRHQITLLAIHYAKEIQAEREQAQARGK